MKPFFLITVLLCSSLLFAQKAEFTAASPANDVIAQGVTVKFTYTLPADDPLVVAGKTNPAMQPTTIVWFWGDEESGAKTKSYTQANYTAGAAITHTYRKPGNYGVKVVVTDTKNRHVRQAGMTVKISAPVEVQ